MQVLEVILAQVDAIQQDLTFCRIIQTGNQFHDGRFALAIFADQSEAFVGMQLKINAIEYPARVSGVTERNISELDSPYDWPGRRQGIGFGLDRRLHFEKRQQVCKEQCLVADAGES